MSDDRLHETLTTLRRDIDGVPLAGSADVRRRGAQRTRRQAIAGVAATTVLLGGALGIATQLANPTNTTPPPPATQAPTTTTPTTQPPTTAPATVRLADNWQLRPTDLRGFDPYKGFVVTQPQPTQSCIPMADGWAAEEARAVAFYEPELEGARIQEYALRYADVAAAEAAVAKARKDIANCPKGADPVSVRAPSAVDAGDEAFTASRLAAPPNSEYSYYELGVARRGAVVVVLQWGATSNPNDKNGPQDPSGPGGPTGAPLWDETRLGLALERAIAD